MGNEGKLKIFASLDTDGERAAISECINKIMNTLSFRKLAGKTQVILSLSGPDVRTRLTHTIEVARIARDVCNDLGLNADLAEAIALAHDIGHTPFGHVGERTLREIMCGCDTLGDKVNDCDFDNSGFKHNLQSFRVLENFEQITKEHKNIWPHILWGAVAHSNMSWSKPYSGMEDEILISSKHCDWVYVCSYDKKKECKRNIQKKKKQTLKSKKEICKPWFCANLDVVEDVKEVKQKDLEPGETKREYIKKEYIKKEYQKKIYCSRKCYLAELWKYRIEKRHISTEHPYLFDHPFPNTFYSKSLTNYFFDTNDNKKWKDYISLEAIIVSQADEIAQRQQDLEDGINKGLLTFEEAKDKEHVRKLLESFKDKEQVDNLLEKVAQPEQLGRVLVDFYKEAIVSGTSRNIKTFVESSKNKPQEINIFSLLNILYSFCHNSARKGKWILEELRWIQGNKYSEEDFQHSLFRDHFVLNTNPAYLYLWTYDYLEDRAKNGSDESMGNSIGNCIDIISACLKCLQLDVNRDEKALEALAD